MPIKRLKDFLDQQGVRYVTISHSPAFTAQEIAASAHIPGKALAKTVIVKVGEKMAMVVLPASLHVDFKRLKDEVGRDDVALATEDEFKGEFPASEVGAMPPFGNLYDMDVFVASELTEDAEIAFNAGSHTELMKLAYKDFERVVRPRVVDIAI
jgi:Ala-tRNA(Pro) deacylase